MLRFVNNTTLQIYTGSYLAYIRSEPNVAEKATIRQCSAVPATGDVTFFQIDISQCFGVT